MNFPLTAYVGTDSAGNNQQPARLLLAPDYTCMAAAREDENIDTTFLGVQTVLLKTLRPQYFIKLKRYTYLYRLLFVDVETFNVQLQADFSQFSSGVVGRLVMEIVVP